MTRCSYKTRGITLKAIVLELCPFLPKFLNDGPSKTHVVLLLVCVKIISDKFIKFYKKKNWQHTSAEFALVFFIGGHIKRVISTIISVRKMLGII